MYGAYKLVASFLNSNRKLACYFPKRKKEKKKLVLRGSFDCSNVKCIREYYAGVLKKRVSCAEATQHDERVCV